MEKIALLGDIHFGIRSSHPLIKKHIRDGQFAFFDKLIEDLNERKITTILISGDLHDSEQIIDIETLILTRNLFKEKMKNFDIHIILGNHDLYYNNDYSVSSLELFDDLSNVTVYKNNVQIKEFIGKKWYMFPWVIQKNKENVVSFLTNLGSKNNEKKEKTVIFGHFDMFGMKMDGNNISSNGFDPNMFLNASKLTISGHYHSQSITEKTGSKIVYLGTPYQLTFANANELHGYWIIDEDENMEFVENTVSPKFIDITDTDNLDDIFDLSNYFVRFYINKNISSEDEYELRLKIENKKPILIKTMPYELNDDNTIIVEDVIDSNEKKIVHMSTMDLANVYMEQNKNQLPTLKLNDDPKIVIMNKLKQYETTIKK